MRHIRLVVEYDGTGLHGWQRQANGPTVQQHLEEVLATLVQHEVRVSGASRTDAGVHARGPVALFHTERTSPPNELRRGGNSLLPDQIAIRDAAEVDDAFHPRHSATGKHYRYTILQRADRSPRFRDRAWHHADPLDLAAMVAAAKLLTGEHDFSAFRSAGCAAKTTVRRVESITITPADHGSTGFGDLLHIDIRGNAFLRQMVRIMVGTIADCGVGELLPAQVAEILASKDRRNAGRTAPPQGLELVEVRYDGGRGKPRPADV
ncbi:tRNA pseudouridine(38-40) synthase TruA [soil metagenome]